MENFNLDDQINKLAKAVQFKVARSIKKYNVETSTSETVNITITKKSTYDYSIVFDFREGLRWTTMGVGRGTTKEMQKGQSLSRKSYESNLAKYTTSRKRKPVIYQHIMSMISSIRKIGKAEIVEQTTKSFTVNIVANGTI